MRKKERESVWGSKRIYVIYSSTQELLTIGVALAAALVLPVFKACVVPLPVWFVSTLSIGGDVALSG